MSLISGGYTFNDKVSKWISQMKGGLSCPPNPYWMCENDIKGTRAYRRQRKKQGKYNDRVKRQDAAYSKIESLPTRLKKAAYMLFDSEDDELLDTWTGSNGKVYIIVERYDKETGDSVTITDVIKNSKKNKNKNVSVIKVLGTNTIKDIFSNYGTTIRKIPTYVNYEQLPQIYKELYDELTDEYFFSEEQADEIVDRIEEIAEDIGKFGKTNPWPFVYNTVHDIYEQLYRYYIVAGKRYNATIAYEALSEEFNILNSKNENINKTGKNKELNSLTKNGVSEKINLNQIQEKRKRKKEEKKKAKEKYLLEDGIINTGNYNEKNRTFKQQKQKTVNKETIYENANIIEKHKRNQEKEKERERIRKKENEKFRKNKIKKAMEKRSPEKIKKQQEKEKKEIIRAKKRLLTQKQNDLKKLETTKKYKEKKKENTTNINKKISNLRSLITNTETNIKGGGKKGLIRKKKSIKKTLKDKRCGKYKHKNHTHKTKKAMEKCTR
jgi:hypothetical protein